MVQRVCVLLAAVLLLTAANVHAEMIIDQFNTPDDQSLKVTAKQTLDSDVSRPVRPSTAGVIYRSGCFRASQAMLTCSPIPGAAYFTQGTGRQLQR